MAGKKQDTQYEMAFGHEMWHKTFELEFTHEEWFLICMMLKTLVSPLDLDEALRTSILRSNLDIYKMVDKISMKSIEEIIHNA